MINPSTDAFLRGTSRDSGTERVAQFLMLTGPYFAARVLPFFTEFEVTEIMIHVVKIRNLSNRRAFRILEEFGYLAQTSDLFTPGGPKTARQMLGESFDEKTISSLLSLAIKSYYKNSDATEVRLISNRLRTQNPIESVFTIISLSPRLTALALSSLPIEQRLEIICCISSFKPETEGSQTSSVDPFEIVSEIISCMDQNVAEETLDSLEQFNLELWLRMCINGILFPFMMERMLLKTDINSLENILRDKSDYQVFCALSGATKSLSNRLQCCLPAVRQTEIQLMKNDHSNTLLAERLGSLQAIVEEICEKQANQQYGENNFGR